MTTKRQKRTDCKPCRAGIRDRICLLFLCVLTLPAAHSVSAAPYPPEIAAWDNAEIRRQEENAVRLLQEIRAAVAAGVKEYKMPRDHYRFSHDRAPSLLLKGIRDFTLDGNGSTIWNNPFYPRHAMLLLNCSRVTVKNLTFDNDPPGFMQGVVTAVTPENFQFTVRIDEGYPEPSQWEEKLRAGRLQAKLIFADRERRLLDNQKMDWLKSAVRGTAPREWVLTSRNNLPFEYNIVHPGLLFACAPRATYHLLSLWESGGCTLEEITIHAAGHMALTESRGSGGHRYRRVRVVRRPGTSRILACNADVFHSALTQKGPTLEECEFSHALDDLITVHGSFSYVYRQDAPDTVTMLTELYPLDFTGSKVRFCDFSNGELSPPYTVLSSQEITTPAEKERAAGNYETFRLTRTVPTMKRLHPRSYLIRIKLDRPLTIHGTSTFADTDKFAGKGSVIRNSYLHDGFVRGILMKADGTIENNRIERTGCSGILVHPDVFFLENPFPHDVRIAGNTFRDTNLSINGKFFPIGHGGGASISIFQPLRLSERGFMENFVIENNTILTPAAQGIILTGVRNALLRNNRIVSPFHRLEACPIRNFVLKNPAAIYLQGNENITLTGNRVENLPAEFPTVIPFSGSEP